MAEKRKRAINAVNDAEKTRRSFQVKKGWISIAGGIILGLAISYFVLDYNSWTLVTIDKSGKTTGSINELDFDLMTNALGIMLLCTAVVYGILTVFRKKRQANK